MEEKMVTSTNILGLEWQKGDDCWLTDVVLGLGWLIFSPDYK